MAKIDSISSMSFSVVNSSTLIPISPFSKYRKLICSFSADFRTNYKLLWTDVGGFGAMTDSQIFNESELKHCPVYGTINFPDPNPLPNDACDTSYFILVDDAFALQTYLMKLYYMIGLAREQDKYNYRL